MNLTLDIDTSHSSQFYNQISQPQCVSCYACAVCLLIVLLYFLKKYMAGPYFNTQGFDLTGKYAVVTGGNSGIGKETVLQLIRLNCNVIFGARDRPNSEKVVKMAQKIIFQKNPKSNMIIEQYHLDLGSKNSIQQFSEVIHQRFPKIDYLVNNAGVSLIPQRRQTKEGFEFIYGVNHLGHFFLTYLLMDLVKKSDFFRIINVSSRAHKRLVAFGPSFTIDWNNMHFTVENSYEHNLAYSRSKVCNVMFTKGLAQRIPNTKGICVCLHPGVVNTEILRHVPFLKNLSRVFYPLFWMLTKNSWQGAQTTLYTLLDKSVESGEYYADCKKNSVNPFAVEKLNVEKLWEISEKDLGIKFHLRM